MASETNPRSSVLAVQVMDSILHHARTAIPLTPVIHRFRERLPHELGHLNWVRICAEEFPHLRQSGTKQFRNEKIIFLRVNGRMSLQAIADVLGVSKSTVSRVVAQSRSDKND